MNFNQQSAAPWKVPPGARGPQGSPLLHHWQELRMRIKYARKRSFFCYV